MSGVPHVARLLLWSAAFAAGASAATAFAADTATPAHGWGKVDWGMTPSQVGSAYGDDIAELPHAPNQRKTEIAESLRLKSKVTVNRIAMWASFGFARADRKLERVVLRADLPDPNPPACQAAYGRIRQSLTDQMQAPIEEKPSLRSVQAIWRGKVADARLSELEVTGRCFVTLVFKRPSPASAASDESAGNPDAAPTPTQPPR